MYSFRNDYSEGSHPAVLNALARTNLEQTCGYGYDPYCAAAAERICKLCGRPDADVHFLMGGTQTNLVFIHASLRSFEAVISATTAHINVHETGAIEATGHKVIAVPSPDGKLTPSLIQEVLAAHSTEHMVRPRLIYLSDSTELGTIYTRSELIALRALCTANGLLIFLDGARLGSALTAEGNDLTLADLAELTDAFYIGGTKNGALFGEALVLTNPSIKTDFRFYMKQRGAILAKGRLLGIQFNTLLENDLYFQLARHANTMATRLREGIAALGYPFASDSPSNQIFPILPDPVVERLRDVCEFEVDHPESGGKTCIRLVTSWATPTEAVDRFLQDLSAIG